MWLIKRKESSNIAFILAVLIVNINSIYAQDSTVKEYTAIPIPIMEQEFDVVQMFAIDDFLIISKQQRFLESGDFLFRLLKIPEMEFICEFGRVGRGPGEFEPQTRHNGVIKVFSDSIQLWLYEINKTKLHHVTLHHSHSQKAFLKINKTVKIPFELNLSTPVYLKNNRIAGKVLSFDMNLPRMRFYNLESKEIIDCPLLTTIKNKKPSDVSYVQNIYNPAFASFVSYSAKNSIFISAMLCIDRIDIYNDKGKHIKAILNSTKKLKAKYPEDILMKKYSNKGSIRIGNYYYRSPIVYKDFFAVLYLGKKFDNAIRDESLSCQLRFYNYVGELKAVLNINENINTYTIDEKRGMLFASSRFSGKNFKYDLKHILDAL